MATKLSKADFKSKIAEAKVNAKKSFNDIEVGQYTFKLQGYIIKPDNNGEENIIGTWKITSGEESEIGKDFQKYFSMEKGLGFLFQEWRALGVDTDTLDDTYEDLVKHCKIITKAAPEIIGTIYMQKGYPKLRVDEVIEGDDNAAAEPAATKPAAATAKPTVSTTKPAATKTAAKVEVIEEVSDVEPVETVEEAKEIGPGSKIIFNWKGVEKEGEIETATSDTDIKVLADNNGKRARFPITAEMIVKVL